MEIEADNRKRQEWNRAVDMALISGISEPQIMEVKQKRISEPIKSAISRKGRKPNLFAKVVTMAIEELELMIETVPVKKYKESLEQKEELQKIDDSDMEPVMPETERTEVEIKESVERQPEPKQPEMTRLASKYPRFYKIYNELEQQNNAIYKKEKQRSAKKKELSEIKGWFKGRKKKELQEEIDDLTSQIRNMKDYLPKIVQKVGYRNVQEFLKDFQTAKSQYRQYQKAIAQWKQETGKEPEPQPHGVRAKLAANRKKINRTGTEKHAAYPKSEPGSRGEIGGQHHGETHYGRKWNQLYFGRGRSVLSRPVPPKGDGVSDWEVWNVTKDVFKGASERAVSGVGTCRETE